jgi:hypothetical protein
MTCSQGNVGFHTASAGLGHFDQHDLNTVVMEEFFAEIFNVTANIFGYFYDEWGWSGVLFLLFWGGVAVWFTSASVFAWFAERFGKKD